MCYKYATGHGRMSSCIYITVNSSITNSHNLLKHLSSIPQTSHNISCRAGYVKTVLQANTVALLGNTEPAFISDKQHKLLPNKWHIPVNIQYMYIH